jgi:MinD-like ATPase involved in chromosome partitioning or flagellar assembly
MNDFDEIMNDLKKIKKKINKFSKEILELKKNQEIKFINVIEENRIQREKMENNKIIFKNIIKLNNQNPYLNKKNIICNNKNFNNLFK